MIDFFQAVDPALYDLSMPFVVPGLRDARRVRRETFAALLGRNRDWVGADIGIGTGSDAATMFPEQARGLLYGIDASPLLTSELATRRALPAASLPDVTVELVHADFGAPGAMDSIRRANPEGVDFATSAFAIHNVPHERQQIAFDNAAHMLKRGGYFFYMDLITFADPTLNAAANAADLAFISDEMRDAPPNIDLEAWHDLQRRWLEHYRGENFLFPLSGAGDVTVTGMLERSGFSEPVTLYRYLHTTLLLSVKR